MRCGSVVGLELTGDGMARVRPRIVGIGAVGIRSESGWPSGREVLEVYRPWTGSWNAWCKESLLTCER